MRAGRLRHRVELQSPARSQNATGAVSTIWTTYATVWAALEPFRAAEERTADQVQAKVTHKITLRFNGTITTRDRILLATYTGTSGAAEYNNTGCTIDSNGGLVRLTDAGNFAAGLAGKLVKCDFSATYTDGVYEITTSTANSITINLPWSSNVPTAEVWVGARVISVHRIINPGERGIYLEIEGTEVIR